MKDLADIVALVRIGQIDVKDSKFRALCEKYGTGSIYEKVANAIKG